MNDILTCKHCNKELGIKQFGRHVWKVHTQKYEDYVKSNIDDFKSLNWKLCSECGTCYNGLSSECGTCYNKSHKINTDQSVICKHCNSSVHSKIISHHLKKIHNINFMDYVKDNLLDFKKFGWNSCVICNTICKSNSKRHIIQPTCSFKCAGEIRKTWTGKKSYRYGIPMSIEGKKNISLSKIGIPNYKIRGNLNSSCRDEVKQKISKTRIDRQVAVGNKNPMFGKTHTPEAIAKIFARKKMNKLEKIVADVLDKNGVMYYFQFFITKNGVCKSYDFKIKSKPIIIEVDGDYWHGNPDVKHHHISVNETIKNDKLKDVLAKDRGYKVIRLWESDIKKDPSIVLKYIG